ncbi:hypothetical protein COLSTE_01815 [Collinsella stercoris DSM 13279]|uniref:Uncharacterized protein n=1 Tax=Collinsella stercoris DSM 13279 TaxID=445975 RepID=B6GCJ2_9ACTN|nr:hypothetical protein COLSTE_01815 [Collinsella stercoris DSM 13279]
MWTPGGAGPPCARDAQGGPAPSEHSLSFFVCALGGVHLNALYFASKEAF